MSYYVTMSDCCFTSNLSGTEINERAGEFELGHFSFRQTETTIEVVPPDEDWYMNYDEDDEANLRRFISTVIAPGHYVELSFRDDGGEWGSLIFHTNPFDLSTDDWQIFHIEWEPMVKNKPLKQFASDYLKQFKEETDEKPDKQGAV